MKRSLFIIALLSLFTAPAAVAQQKAVSAEISSLLNKEQLPGLHFPGTVKRLYTKNDFQPYWIKPQSGAGPAWQLMMMLDCVLQYGLSAGDYHPDELTYNLMHRLLDTVGQGNVAETAQAEIFLSDAMITFVNHLHYGRFNPRFSGRLIDDAHFSGFHADSAILAALPEKKAYDFWQAIEKVQPVSKAYRDLQRRMRMLEGLYSGDNYEVSDQEIRLLAVNMERLRWAGPEREKYIRINIPAFTLQYHGADNDYIFRVAVGDALHQTPELHSKVTYLTTAPDVVVPRPRFIRELLPTAMSDTGFLKKNQYALYDNDGRYVVINSRSLEAVNQDPDNYVLRHASGHDAALGRLVFRFSNPQRIDLHDMPKKAFFERSSRALTTGCIWLDDAEMLGRLVLTDDGQRKPASTLAKAMKKYQREVYSLRNPFPLNIVYLTCTMQDGELIVYPDIYQKDRALEHLLFPQAGDLTAR